MFMNFKLKKITKINKLLDERASFLHMYLLYNNEQIKKDVTIIYLNNYLNKLNKENK
ncbi:hypothetical protein [Spiroplasma endosymbiont of Amphimallon solstitiale]|uniref:hypothetical protein n=1 Tax=Spiroplasma endosymbiont of Amphimallon solstitiale TaxID=3066288 RepID=UPI00313B548E